MHTLCLGCTLPWNGPFQMVKQWSQQFHATGFSVKITYPDENSTCCFPDLEIYMDCLTIVNKINVEQHDIPILRDTLEQILVDSGLSIDDLEVRRIDFCYNVRIPEPQRGLLITILQKLPKSSFYVERHNVYHTSLYYSSKSRCIQVYDKEAERMATEKPIQDYETDVVRFEIQLKTRHIQYRIKQCKEKLRNKETPKYIVPGRHFDVWVNWSVYQQFLSEAIERMIYIADFFDIDRATTKLKHSKLSESYQNKLRNFLVAISRLKSIDKAAVDLDAKTKRTYLKRLQEAGVNPILIPKHYNLSYMKNPFQAICA